MSIELRQVEKWFADNSGNAIQAIDKVDLSIADGEFVALLGPSGCGKSTLINLIAGLDAVSTGELLFQGKPICNPGADRAVVFQEAALFPWLTVIENIKFAIQSGTGREKADKALYYINLVHLNKFKHAYPYQLSGGMKQRVAIARALATDSPVLLMDEPFAALDEQTRMMLQAELLRIWQYTKKTVVFVTHHIREAIYLAERIVLFSYRPARVIKEYSISIPRPRVPDNFAAAQLEAEILAYLKIEMEKAVAEEIGEEYLLEAAASSSDIGDRMGSSI
ncbi:ABC transporter ATP-binding protein [Sporomusa sp. KB1]|jgi:NitT/TauT family transport system ATP-binding protein|uniref:ABC transporter ATP-binding protein n=1 Tax=Sporomusa sp. KB1 TaxID=943346 RepID=UPI00119F788E|nr:ABC transporter ATP-binding protein [Sporomusa sp. KB1]TWH48809.1 NitT/TauT family transport system ATP-binding protein [Sporomusa sp. KB1]